jgi:hypothetical protein
MVFTSVTNLSEMRLTGLCEISLNGRGQELQALAVLVGQVGTRLETGGDRLGSSGGDDFLPRGVSGRGDGSRKSTGTRFLGVKGLGSGRWLRSLSGPGARGDSGRGGNCSGGGPGS